MYAITEPQLPAQGLLGLLVTLAVLGLLLWWKYGRGWKPSASDHGTARWAGADDKVAMRTGHIPLGRDPDTGNLLFLPRDAVHVSVFAPTGSGKGVSYLIPISLTYHGSLVVIDVKGEARDLTKRRRERLGKVFVLDPYGTGGHTFNPMDVVNNLDDAGALAEALVVRNPNGEAEPHWLDKAQEILTGLIGLVAAKCPPDERNLNSVREILAGGLDGAAQALKGMGGLYARYGHSIAGMQDKERSGVISSAIRCLTFMDSPAMDAQLRQSSFKLESLIGEQPCTVFAVLQPEHLLAKVGWLRLITTCVIRLMVRNKSRRELLMLIDEAGQLQHMPALTQGLTLMRSYGLRMWLFYQSMQQLKDTFKEHAGTVIGNTSKLFFGVNDLDTAKWVSEYLGGYTQLTSSYSRNTSRSKNTNEYGLPSGSVSTSENLSHSTCQRLLLTPDEVVNLPCRAVVALIHGCRPLLIKRVLWFKDEHLKRLQKRGE